MRINRPSRRVKKASISGQLRARAERERRLSQALGAEFSNTIAEIKNELESIAFVRSRGPGISVNPADYFEPEFLALDERQRNMALYTLRAKLARMRRSSTKMRTLYFKKKFLRGNKTKIEREKTMVKELAGQFEPVSKELHEIFTGRYFALADHSAFGGKKPYIGREWHTTTHTLKLLLSVAREKS